MSTFDPNLILNAETTEANDTQLIPVPESDDGYMAVISKVEIRTAGDKPVAELHWDIDDQQVQAATGRDKNTVRQTVWLDLTPHGTLDMSKGKNTGLGKVRDAVGQNQAGKPWSFGTLQGSVARVFVSHRILDDGQIVAQIKRVTKA